MTTAPPLKSPWGMAGSLPPLGLAYVAAALQKNGYKVEIFDNYLLQRPIEEVKSELKKRASRNSWHNLQFIELFALYRNGKGGQRSSSVLQSRSGWSASVVYASNNVTS